MCESEPKREWSGWGLTSPSTHRTRVLPVIHLHRYEESDQKKTRENAQEANVPEKQAWPYWKLKKHH